MSNSGRTIYTMLFAVSCFVMLLGIVFGMTFFVAFGAGVMVNSGYKFYHELPPRPAKAIKQSDAIAELDLTREVFDCEVFDQSCLDRRMFEAGIIPEEEISVCEDYNCPNCSAQFKRIAEINRIRLRDQRREAAKMGDDEKLDALSAKEKAAVEKYQLNELTRMGRPAKMQRCQMCGDPTFVETHCPTCLTSELERQKRYAWAKKEQDREAKARYNERMEYDVVQDGNGSVIHVYEKPSEYTWRQNRKGAW